MNNNIIVLSSGNIHKVKEIRYLLNHYSGKEFNVISLLEAGITEDVVENGNTFLDNSIIKASLPAKYGYIGLADDSGLCVESLNGEPGIYSARYAGEPCNDLKNNCTLLGKLSSIEAENRNAKFVCSIAAVFPNGKIIHAEGFCNGRILYSPRGNDGFGYDPFFYYEPLGKTFAELSSEEKNAVSHRSNAMKQFVPLFADYMEDYIG